MLLQLIAFKRMTQRTTNHLFVAQFHAHADTQNQTAVDTWMFPPNYTTVKRGHSSRKVVELQHLPTTLFYSDAKSLDDDRIIFVLKANSMWPETILCTKSSVRKCEFPARMVVSSRMNENTLEDTKCNGDLHYSHSRKSVYPNLHFVWRLTYELIPYVSLYGWNIHSKCISFTFCPVNLNFPVILSRRKVRINAPND